MPTACMPLGKGGCVVQGGPWVGCEGCVCGHGVGGCREARNAHAPRVPLRPWKPPRRERGATHCVCVLHTARRRLWSVCVQLVGLEWEEGASRARDTVCWRAADHRMRSAAWVCVRAMAEAGGCACLGAKKRCASRRKFVGRKGGIAGAGGALHGRGGRCGWVFFWCFRARAPRTPLALAASQAAPFTHGPPPLY